MNFNFFRVLFVCTISTVAWQSANSDESAEMVFVNGLVYAGNIKNPWSSEFAVSDGHFLYVGDDVSLFVGTDTKVYDLGGKTVIPGLIDAHSHPGFVALSSKLLSLEDTSTRDNLMASIRKMVADNPNDEVLIGGFWPNEFFDVTGPHKNELDEIEPNRPLILYDDWAHTVWANSSALEQAGITRRTKDLVPGFSFFQRNGNGDPTGWITESAASTFINNFQEVTPTVEETLLEYLNYYRDIGVTTVLDAGNFGLDREMYAAVSKLDKEGQLPVRYHGAYTLFVPSDLPDAIEKLKQLGADFNSEKVRIDTLKIFFDGVLETRTAALSRDYLDTPNNSGEALLSREEVHQLILDLEREGLNLHVHAVGDRATSTILDAVQNAHDSLQHAPTIRIAICHLEVVKDEDFDRFKKLGVVANFTPHWWTGGGRSWVAEGIGAESLKMQRAQPLLSDGAVVTFSSDITDKSEWKSERANPFLGIQVGHTRQDVGAEGKEAFLPPLSDRVQRENMVNGYTSNAAYQLGRSDEMGSILVGNRADFLILNQNLFDVDKYEIHKTKPDVVIVDGNFVFGALEESSRPFHR